MPDSSDVNDKTILIVDDDESICDFLDTLLRKEGYHTFSCTNGEKAVQIVNNEKVDLVILDWMMPILSGFEVLKMLQTKEHMKIPVVVITAKVTDAGTIRTIRQEINVVDFITKPIQIIPFTGRVRKILNPQVSGGPKT